MDTTADLDEEKLLIKHRNERRELQAEIQKLKKSISKGDKKRKKEVNEEIAQLEADLNSRQEEELASPKASEKVAENAAVDGETNLTSPMAGIENGMEGEEAEEKVDDQSQRKSKAQKRKDKKQVKDKEREQRIQEQAIENRHGPRQQELLKIMKVLKDRGLALHEISADGNCMYNAVGHQLALRNIEKSCAELRETTARFMRDHSDEFLPFLTHPGTGDMMTLEEFSVYCDKTASSPVWGGQLELRALSEVLETPIQVIQADVQPLLIGETKDGPPITLVYQRHAYRLGEHYNSVSPRDPSDNNQHEEGEELEAVD